MTPCPCGYLGDAQHRCACTIQQVQRYRSRIAGPLLDRIDLHVEVHRLPYRELADAAPGETSAAIRARAYRARATQLERFAGRGCFVTRRCCTADLRTVAAIDDTASLLLERTMLAASRCPRLLAHPQGGAHHRRPRGRRAHRDRTRRRSGAVPAVIVL
jgi:magnesium chelatase family protein